MLQLETFLLLLYQYIYATKNLQIFQNTKYNLKRPQK